MKNLLTILLLTFTLTACSENSVDISTDFKDMGKYASIEDKISIRYPSGWQLQEDLGNVDIIFISPTEGENDNFSENLSIQINDLPAGINTIYTISESGISQLSQSIKDFEIESEEELTIDQRPAYKTTYTGKDGDINLKWTTLFTFKKDKAYVLTFAAEEKKHSRYTKVIDTVFKSFDMKVDD